MSAPYQALRLWRYPFAMLMLILPLNAHAQPSNNSAPPPTSEQLTATIARVRASKPPDPARIAEAQATGFELLRGARYQDALALFRAILEVVPTDRAALYGGALASFNLQHIAEAEEMARAVIERSTVAGSTSIIAGDELANAEAKNWRIESLTLLGVILAVKGDNAGALSALKEAVTLAPENFDARFALGRALYGAGDPAGAAAAFRAAIKTKPDDTRARFFLATALEGAGDNDGALAAYRELLIISPESAEGHLGLGALLVKLGGELTNEGIRELTRAVALGGDLYEARITLGRALLRAGRASESVEHLQRAAALAPQNPEPHYQLALAYRRLGKTAEAERENAIVKEIHAARRKNNAEGNSAASPDEGQKP